MQLTNIYTIKAELVCKTGMHIGTSDTEMHIGGIDKEVIRDPLTDRPYIPGSSIKGKMRSLLEWRSGFVGVNENAGEPFSLSYYDDCKKKGGNAQAILDILRLFGVSADDNSDIVGPTRLSFWDCPMSEAWHKEVSEAGVLVTEDKTENDLNRMTSAANPRHMERVIAGAKFEFTLTVKEYGDDDKKLLDTVLAGLKLLEMDSIGGSGSRGYGKIKFGHLHIERVGSQDVDLTERFEKVDPFA